MPPVVSAVVAIGAAIIGSTAVGTAFLGGLSLAGFVGVTLLAGAGAIAAGVMLVSKLMSPDVPGVADTDQSRQVTTKSTVEPIKIIYGEALVSGPLVYVGVSGTDNEDLAHVIALAGHEVEAITDIYLDDEIIANPSGAVTTGTFGPIGGRTMCEVTKHLGTADQVADPGLVAAFSEYGAANRGRGIAYIYTNFRLTADSQELWDKYQPNNIRAIVKGRKIYDPRLDSTAGANPTNSSYIAYSDNPALCVADYLINTHFGMGVLASKVDWGKVVIAANACDVSVLVPGGTQKRFTANGVLFGTDPHMTSLNKLLSSFNGSLIYSGGEYIISAGVYAAPTHTLDENDLAGPISVRTSVERSDRFNAVKTIIIDPLQGHKSVEAPRVQLTAALNRDNGETFEREINLPFTNSSYMAQRIANKLIQMSDQQKLVTFPANLSAMAIAVGDRVNVTVGELNWSNKVFRCMGWAFTDSGIALTLGEDDAGSYADPAVIEYSTITADGVISVGFPGVPDPQSLSAVAGIQSIDVNWTNPAKTSKFSSLVLYASPTNQWSAAVEIGRGLMTSFKHDASTSADPIAAGSQRYYWVRALGVGPTRLTFGDRNPDNDTSTIEATALSNSPDFTDVVDDTPGQIAPSALTLVETTVLGNDGSVLPAVRVSWTPPSDSQYVSFFEVEFKQTSQGEIDYGLTSDAYTSTINYGSVADATTFELNYGGVNEEVVGGDGPYSSINVYGVSTVIAGMRELEEFTFRVRAVTRTGKVSSKITAVITLQGDQVAPAAPSSITATGGIHQIKLDWENPSDSDLSFIEIFENTTNNLGTSALVVQTFADQHTITDVPNLATRYYWLRSSDRSGNFSGYSSVVSATTGKIGLDDLNQGVIDQFAAGDAFGIEPVSTLTGVSGDHIGQVKLLTTTDTLYVWTGTVWSTEIFTASNVDPGAITAASFASGVEPISAVTSLPSPTGYTGPNILFLTTDKKLYRYDSTVPEFTTLVNTADIAGTLGENLFSDTLRPIERVGTLPLTGLVTGRVVMLTTDSKLYRYTGSAWTSAIAAADMTDQLNLATQASGLLPAANAAAELVNGNITINADGTLSGGGAGQATLGGLGAGQVASLDTITETFIDDNAISTAKIQTNAITSNLILAGQIIASKLAVDSVTANSVSANSINTSALISGSVVADSLAVGAVVADKISANAVTTEALDTNSVNASKIIAGSITADEINVTSLFADTAVIGAIQSSSITTSAVVSAIGSFEFISALNIVTGTILASKLDINEIFSNSLVLQKTSAASPVQSVAGETGNITAQTIITAGGIAITSQLPTAVSQLSNDSAFVNSSGAANAAPVQSVAGLTGAITASTLISAGSLVVQGEISNLITGSEVNQNVTSISGGTITTGTINVARINVDGVTISSNGTSLIIKAAGVSTGTIAPNAVTTPANMYTAAYLNTISTSYVTVQSVTFTTTGHWVDVSCMAYLRAVSGSGGHGAFVRVVRDSTVLSQIGTIYVPGSNGTTVSAMITDKNAAAGPHVYKFQIKRTFGSVNLGAGFRYVRAVEIKR